jgi:hypothetical protein
VGLDEIDGAIDPDTDGEGETEPEGDSSADGDGDGVADGLSSPPTPKKTPFSRIAR